MIRVKIRGPTALQGVVASLEKEYAFGRKAIWIGRGQQISQKQNEHNYVLNVGEISKSVSRIHACLLMSPAFWFCYDFTYPSYYKKLGPLVSQLPENILFQIWELARPARKIILKDLHSKTGVYKKVKSLPVSTGLELVLGDTRPLIFHHQEIYDSSEQMNARLEALKDKEYHIMNESQHDRQVHSFWTMSYRNQHYILLNYPSKITIGRSSNNNFVICEASISRRHATLEFSKGNWQVYDGDGKNLSSNGVWQRVKKVEIEYRCRQKELISGESTIKLGDILFNFEIKQDFSYLNVTELCTSYKNSTNNQSFNSQQKRQIETGYPMLTKGQSNQF